MEARPIFRADEEAILQMFKDMSTAHLSFTPGPEIEWLALAQHHGMPTRLLDWTEGLLVAAWFAVMSPPRFGVRKEPKTGKEVKFRKDPAIWAVRNVTPLSGPQQTRPFDVPTAHSYRPRHINARISAQRSVFTIHSEPEQEFSSSGLVKFTIDEKCAFELSKRLDACGINQKAIYPDLVGLCEYLAWRYKNNWLSGYRSR